MDLYLVFREVGCFEGKKFIYLYEFIYVKEIQKSIGFYYNVKTI